MPVGADRCCGSRVAALFNKSGQHLAHGLCAGNKLFLGSLAGDIAFRAAKFVTVAPSLVAHGVPRSCKTTDDASRTSEWLTLKIRSRCIRPQPSGDIACWRLMCMNLT